MEHYFQQSKEDEDAKLSQALAEVGVAARGAYADSTRARAPFRPPTSPPRRSPC
jgi:hypothetical protein